jgi:hypothetical protein
MGAHVQGRVDALCNDSDRLQILRVIHLVAGVTNPAGRMHIHDVGEIDDFHHTIPGGDRSEALNRSQEVVQRQMDAEQQ